MSKSFDFIRKRRHFVGRDYTISGRILRMKIVVLLAM